MNNQNFHHAADSARFPDLLAELDVENYARSVVQHCSFAEFVGIQKDFGGRQPLVLIRHKRLNGSAVAIRLHQLDELTVSLSVIAQWRRYFGQ